MLDQLVGALPVPCIIRRGRLARTDPLCLAEPVHCALVAVGKTNEREIEMIDDKPTLIEKQSKDFKIRIVYSNIVAFIGLVFALIGIPVMAAGGNPLPLLVIGMLIIIGAWIYQAVVKGFSWWHHG